MITTIYDYNPDITQQNLTKCTNVFVEELADNTTSYVTNRALYQTMAPIVFMHPEWRFVLGDYCVRHIPTGGKIFIFTEVTVFSEGAELGNVSIVSRGTGYAIQVSNDRIREARARRGNAYTTKNPVKATEQIRRTFYKATDTEAIYKASRTADDDLFTTEYEAASGYEEARSEVSTLVYDYVHSVFDSLPDSLRLDPDMQKAQERHQCLESIVKMRKLWNAKTPDSSALLVVLDEGRYIVRSGDEVQIYTADTVPTHIRMKLGMLKLVKEKQCIDDVGVKVSDEVFVLYPN